MLLMPKRSHRTSRSSFYSDTAEPAATRDYGPCRNDEIFIHLSEFLHDFVDPAINDSHREPSAANVPADMLPHTTRLRAAQERRRRVRRGAALDGRVERQFSGLIQGQVLRMSERREVAIFLRDGALWVADFIDGDGVLMEAITWFRFNCGAPSTSHARHRMVLESGTPLSEELIEKIERLHRDGHPGMDTCKGNAG